LLSTTASSPYRARSRSTNNGGDQPGGQQPTCTGGGLNQDTDNRNPAGHAPPGHN
jgi:hypothetical protein